MSATYRHYKILPFEQVERILAACHVLSRKVISMTELGEKLGLVAFVREESDTYTTPAHRHEYLEIVLVLEGSGHHVIAGTEYPICKGDVFFLNHDMVHTFRAPRGRLLRYVNFAFIPTLLEHTLTIERITEGRHFFLIEPFFRQDDDFRFKLALKGDAYLRLVHLALLIVDCFNRSYPGVSESAVSLFRSFVHVILDEYRATVRQRPALFDRREKIFKEIYGYIEGHLDHKISIDDISAAVGVCRSKVSEIFSKAQGESIISYVNRRRIEQAANLLKQTDLSVSEIAFQVGFNDISHFNTTFRNILKTSPLALRKRRQFPKQ